MSVVDLLDLPPSRGQRVERVRFDLLDADHDVDTDEHPNLSVSTSAAPTLELATDSPIMRRLTGFRVHPDDEARIDVDDNRVQVVLEFESGDAGSYGLFAFEGLGRVRVDANVTLLEATLADEMLLLDLDPATEPFKLNEGNSIRDAMLTTLADAGWDSTEVQVDATTAVAGAPVTWPIGHSPLQRLRDLAKMAGFYPPHTTNAGVPRLAAIPTPTEGVYDMALTTDEVSRVVRGSLVTSSERIRVPNKWLVVSPQTDGTTVTGSYELPADHPWSETTTGRERVKVVQVSGLATTAQAEAAAKAAAVEEITPAEWVQFATPLDPRFEPFTVVELDGELYREVGATITCRFGGLHLHRMERLYP